MILYKMVQNKFNISFITKKFKKSNNYNASADLMMLEGDTLKVIKKIPNKKVKLIITSPPYNLEKEYEEKQSLEDYLNKMSPHIKEFYRVLKNDGSICWQVGNYVNKSEVFPLDIFYYKMFKASGFKLRNRIIWHFNHGLHSSKRLSGRYETLLWFTKSDNYTFNLDKIRVPSKYPGKRKKNYIAKNKKVSGKPSGNPLGKNPSDYWEIMTNEWELGFWDIPNVKANHPEKTLHPCQFPIELVERCIFGFTNEKDLVLDPYSGTGSAILAALKNNRRSIGCEIKKKYIKIALDRVKKLEEGKLPYRKFGKPIHIPSGKEKVAQIPREWKQKRFNF